MVKAIVLSSLFFTFTFSNKANAAESVHGVLRVVKGDVQIKAAKDGSTSKARLGGKIFPKDTIITGKDARAKIVMTDNNEINVSPDSQLVLQSYVYEPEKGKKDVLLNVIYGKVRSKVEQKYDGQQSKFQVKTPSAVAGVRGTDFMTSFNNVNGTSQVVTFEGEVAFGKPGPNNSILGQVTVSPGQMSIVAAGQTPQAPTAVPKTQLTQMDADTNAEGRTPAQQNTPAAEEKKNEPKKEEAKQGEAKSETQGEAKNEAKSEAKNEPKNEAKSEAKSEQPKGEAKGNTQAGGQKSPSASGTGTGTKAPTPTAGGTSSSTTAPPTAGGGSAAGGMSPGAMPGREPSSMPTGSMIGADDLPSSNRGPSFTPPTNFQPPIPPVAQMPICEFCNTVIQNGSQKITIKVRAN